MNPLAKVRSGAGAAAGKIRGGTGSAWSRASGGVRGVAGRTSGGVKGVAARTSGGVRGAAGKVRSGFSGLGDRAGEAVHGVRDGSAELWERSGGARLVHSARSNPRVAIAWAAGGLLLIAWIAWTIYITAEHGASAGLGVLISWPVVVCVLALVSAPFVGAALLIRRLQGGGDGQPPIAGGANGGGQPDPDAFTGGTYPG